MEEQTWTIDTAHTAVAFSVRHMVIAKVRGRFGTFSGKVRGHASDLTRAVIEAEIDASSIDTGVPDRDAHLRSADFFDVEHFPKLLFESTHIEKLSDGRYRVVGQLTLRDVTREVALEVEHGGSTKDPAGNERMAFAGKTSIDRTDFGLRWNQALEAGGVVVSNRVDIEVDAELVRAANAAAA